jgi:hypothetical protein
LLRGFLFERNIMRKQLAVAPILALAFFFSSAAQARWPSLSFGPGNGTPPVQALTQAQILALTPAQIQALTLAQILTVISALTPAQIPALTPAQIPALSLAQIPAVISVLTPAQIPALSLAQIKTVTLAQIKALTPAQIQALTPAQITALNMAAPPPDGPYKKSCKGITVSNGILQASCEYLTGVSFVDRFSILQNFAITKQPINNCWGELTIGDCPAVRPVGGDCVQAHNFCVDQEKMRRYEINWCMKQYGICANYDYSTGGTAPHSRY